MKDLTGKSTGDQLTAADWNELPGSVQVPMTDFGEALDPGDLAQLSEAIADYVASGNFFVEDSGSSTAYTLSTIGTRKGPTGYTNGLEVRFRAVNASTVTVPTIAVNGLAAIDIVLEGGGALSVGDIKATTDTLIRYDSTLSKFILYAFILSATPTVSFPRGFFFGFKHANDGTDLPHDVVVAAGGSCRDAANTQNIIHASGSPFSKRIDAPWDALDGNGGLQSGLTVSANTWYRYFVIAKADGTIDYGWDTSATATGLLDGSNGGGESPPFIAYRQIAWHLTDGSSNIRQYRQSAAQSDRHNWDPGHRLSIEMGGATQSAQNIAVRAPQGSEAILSFTSEFEDGPSEITYYGSVTSKLDPDPGTPSKTNSTFSGTRGTSNPGGLHAANLRVEVDSVNEVRVQYNGPVITWNQDPRLNTEGFVYRPSQSDAG